MKVKKILTTTAIVAVAIAGSTTVGATAKVQGYLDVTYHPVPVIQDSALAFTTLSMPSRDIKNCSSFTTVAIYNSDGECNTDTYSVDGALAWDPPLDTGATAKIRAAKKATGTHKAKSYDTNYKWLKTDNTKWEK